MTRDVVIDALREVYDPCCADRGISIVDMDVVVDGGHVEGYPQLTEQAKRRILGRLHGMEVPA